MRGATYRNRTGNSVLGTDIRYNVFDENGEPTEHTMVTLLKAECLCHSHKGWTYREDKVSRVPVGGDTHLTIFMTKEMREWAQDMAFREGVSASEIVRRCVQKEMDKKRNRFYILALQYNRV